MDEVEELTLVDISSTSTETLVDSVSLSGILEEGDDGCEDCLDHQELEDRKRLYLNGVPTNVIEEYLTQWRQRIIDETSALGHEESICESCMSKREETMRKTLLEHKTPDDMVATLVERLREHVLEECCPSSPPNDYLEFLKNLPRIKPKHVGKTLVPEAIPTM